ncbi:MAG: GNAT family N-acetyltransferase [Anaerolineales bacterium]|nr:GNAT family N-acetyltransferase [Anaerolineales bacterium]
MTTNPITITPAQPSDLPAISALLTQADLPLLGLADFLDTAVVARLENQIVACAALEPYPPDALLRSVIVAPSQRGTGLGHIMTEAALQLARDHGYTAVYLLTETAAHFFPRFGFQPIERDVVPTAVQTSLEFTTACPASAQAMRLRLTDLVPNKPEA